MEVLWFRDIWKLGRDFDFTSREVIRESMADLGTLANNVLGSREKWSLDGLCQNLVSQKPSLDGLCQNLVSQKPSLEGLCQNLVS